MKSAWIRDIPEKMPTIDADVDPDLLIQHAEVAELHARLRQIAADNERSVQMFQEMHGVTPASNNEVGVRLALLMETVLGHLSKDRLLLEIKFQEIRQKEYKVAMEAFEKEKVRSRLTLPGRGGMNGL